MKGKIGKIMALGGLICGFVGPFAGEPIVGFIFMWGFIIFGFLFEWRFEDK